MSKIPHGISYSEIAHMADEYKTIDHGNVPGSLYNLLPPHAPIQQTVVPSMQISEAMHVAQAPEPATPKGQTESKAD